MKRNKKIAISPTDTDVVLNPGNQENHKHGSFFRQLVKEKIQSVNMNDIVQREAAAEDINKRAGRILRFVAGKIEVIESVDAKMKIMMKLWRMQYNEGRRLEYNARRTELKAK